MKKFSCLLGNILATPYKQQTLTVEYTEYQITLYVDGALAQSLTVNGRIMCVAANTDIHVLLADGIHTYQYVEDTSTLKEYRACQIEGVLKGVADKQYMAVRSDAGTPKNILYNLETYATHTIDKMIRPAEPLFILALKLITPNKLLVTYQNHGKELEYHPGTEEWIEQQVSNCKGKERVFLDKRNLLEITSDEIQHLVISTGRAILLGRFTSVVKHNGYVEIETTNGTYQTKRHLSKYVLHKVPSHPATPPSTSPSQPSTPNFTNLTSSFPNTSSTFTTFNSLKPAIDPSSVLTCKDSVIYCDNIPYAKILTRSLFTFTDGTYIHQMLPSGQIKVFQTQPSISLIRTIPTVNTSSITDFYAYSTHKATLTILIYKDTFSVIEHCTEIHHKSTISHSGNIQEVKRHRKDIIIKYNDTYVKYHLDQQKNLQCTILDKTNRLHSLTLSAQNRNRPQVLISISKGRVYTAQVNGKEALKTKFINSFYLLHSGYLYSTGNTLTLSSGESISFLYFIRNLHIHNEVSRSTVLVHLSIGKLYLLSIVNGKIEGRIELKHRIFPNVVELLSLTSFYTIDMYTLTIFEGDAFIHPILRVSFPYKIDSVIFTDKIYISTHNDMIYEISDVPSIIQIARDDSIGVAI